VQLGKGVVIICLALKEKEIMAQIQNV